MKLSFRARIFLGLAALGTLPLALALLVLSLQTWSTQSATGPRAAMEEIAASGRDLISTVDTTNLSEEARRSLARHSERLSRATVLARRAETLSGYASAALGVSILIAAAILVAISLQFARKWSRHISAPVDELISWVRMIQDHTPLPERARAVATPEFESLRSALRDMAEALTEARRREIERERLAVFSETARRVAHEIKSPLTAMRLALAQLQRTEDDPENSPCRVLQEEIERLDVMAREFSEFGRLPEGPVAAIALEELVESVVETTVPPDTKVQYEVAEGLSVEGHYEPMRRTLQNLVRNALDADPTGPAGIRIDVAPGPAGGIRMTVTDHGRGVPDSAKQHIFDPYVTTKKSGTGLGLAVVRQTIEAHGGRVWVEDTAGGGATFVIELPETA
jgi:two-component system nitrogen regulation sensor histidine kinase NtrY